MPADGITIESDIVLYAKWNEIKEQIVTLTRVIPFADGTCAINKATMTKGNVIRMLGTCQAYNRTFVGWYLDADYTQPFEIGDGYTMNEDLTIYAKWAPYSAGDINKDGAVDEADSAMLLSNLINKSVLTHDDFAMVDLNCDGKVDRFDLHALNAYITNKDKLSLSFLPAQNIEESLLDLNADGVVDQADFSEYIAQRVPLDVNDEAFDWSLPFFIL